MTLAPLVTVRKGLRRHLLVYIGTLPLAYENRPFVKPSAEAWMRERIVPQGQHLETLGPGARVRLRGTWFLDYFVPALKGMAGVDAYVDGLENHFYPARQLVESGLTITIEKAFRSGTQSESNFLMVPVTIAWFADGQNPL